MILLGLAAGAVACTGGEEPPATDEVTVRVEDGVTIIEHPGLHVADSTAWSIEAEPFVSIGALEGPPEQLFGRVRAVLLLPSDEILVADDQAVELRRYDLDGRFLGLHGRAGDGPGEFIGMTGLHRLSGDSIAVVNDHEGLRIHRFDPELRFVRRARPRLSAMSAEPPFTSDTFEGMYPSGDLVMADYRRVCEFGAGTPCSDSLTFFRTNEEGDALVRFGTHPYDRSVSVRMEDGPNFAWRLPHPQPMWTVAGDTFYLIDSGRREILAYGPDGRLIRRTRIAGRAPRWSAEDVFPRPEVARGGLDLERLRAMNAVMRDASLPDTFPTFADLVADQDGWLWLREYLPPAVEAQTPPRWYVFDPDGRLRYSVRSPRGLLRGWSTLAIMPAPDIGRAVALGVTTDELGVQRVVGYRILGRE